MSATVLTISAADSGAKFYFCFLYCIHVIYPGTNSSGRDMVRQPSSFVIIAAGDLMFFLQKNKEPDYSHYPKDYFLCIRDWCCRTALCSFGCMPFPECADGKEGDECTK